MVTYWSYDSNIELFFASNQTSNIFHFKILYALFSVSDFSCIDLDITSYISVLALSREEVLRVLQSQGQAACLMASLQEKTIYRSALFLSGDGKLIDAL